MPITEMQPMLLDAACRILKLIVSVGVLSIIAMTRNAQVLGKAIIDTLPSLKHRIIKATFPVVANNGQHISNITIVFKLEVTMEHAYVKPSANLPHISYCSPSSKNKMTSYNAVDDAVKKLRYDNKNSSNNDVIMDSNWQDAVASLLTKSRELQKSMENILAEESKVSFENDRNIESTVISAVNLIDGNTSHEEKNNLFNMDKQSIDIVLGEDSTIDELNAVKMLNHSMASLSSNDVDGDDLSEEDPLYDESILQHLFFEDISKSIPLNSRPTRDHVSKNISESKIKPSILKKQDKLVGTASKSENARIKAKEYKPVLLTTPKTVSSINQSDKNISSIFKGRPISRKYEPVVHCLLSVPEGDGFFLPLIPKCSHTTCRERNPIYLVIRMFWKNDVIRSSISSNGIFAFCQIARVCITQLLLDRLCNNIMSIEVWEKMAPNSDQIIGICKLPLHSFYLTFCDVDLAEDVLNSQQAVIAVNDILPVVDLFCGKKVGRLKVLLAMGTEQQIKHLHQVNDSANDVSTEHIFQISVNHLMLHRPPGSDIWGESDCFVKYTFPMQEQALSEYQLTLSCHTIGPSLCQANMKFATSLKHIILQSSKSFQDNFLKVFPRQGLLIQVWCKFYSPVEVERLVAEVYLPLSSLFTLISKKEVFSDVKTFNLHLAAVNTFAHTPDNGDVGSIEIQIDYKKRTLRAEENISEFVEKVHQEPSISPCINVISDGSTENEVIQPVLSFEPLELFSVFVKIERAIFMPNIKRESSLCILPLNCYVSIIHALSSVEISKTNVIIGDNNPYWKFEEKIALPTDLLFQLHKNLIFQIWHMGNQCKSANDENGLLIGLVFVDLSPLLFGMQQVNGWYNIIDFEGIIIGQLKVSLNPLCGLEKAKASLLAPSMQRVMSYERDFSRLVVCSPMQDGYKSRISDAESFEIRMKENEMFEKLKKASICQEMFDVSKSFLVENLRQKLSNLEGLQLTMKQLLNANTPSDLKKSEFFPELQHNDFVNTDQAFYQCDQRPLDFRISDSEFKNESSQSCFMTESNAHRDNPTVEIQLSTDQSTNYKTQIHAKCGHRVSRVAAAIFHSDL